MEPPPWVDDLLEAVQKQTRAAAKQAARVETAFSELDAQLTVLASAAKKQAAPNASEPRASPEARFDDLFDALDALDEAQQLAREPHLAEGLARVRERLLKFCERAGYTRLVPLGEPLDPKVMRAVGTEAAEGVDKGRITRVVRAAIFAGAKLVREGEAIVSAERQADEHCVGY